MLLSTALTLPAMMAAGLGSSAHCALMCGALGAGPLQQRSGLSRLQALAWLQAGRVAGYSMFGAVAGAAGGRVIALLPDARYGLALQLGAALVLVSTGVYQLRASRRGLAPCCAAEPASMVNAPARLRLLVRGLLWAAVPCGILYGVLALAAFSGSAVNGAAILGAFALGTIPALAAGNFLAAALTSPRNAQTLRYAAALLLIGLGISAIAAALVQTPGIAAWCIARAG